MMKYDKEMYMSKEYQHWLKSRTIFTWLAFSMILLYAMEQQCTKYFLMYYIQDRFGLTEHNAVIFYSISEAIYAIAQITGGIVLGRYSDRTRNMKKVVLIAMLVSFVGNTFYVWHVNLFLVVIGRVLMGFTECVNTAVVGELRRGYNDEPAKGRSVITWYEIAFQVGQNIGAGLPVLFTTVNLKIGFWKLDQLNMMNFILAIFCLIVAIISFFKAIDLSKELDIIKSKYVVSKDDNEMNENGVEKTSKNLMKWSELFQIDIILLCLIYSLTRYAVGTSVSSLTILLPLKYHWSLNDMLVLLMCTNCATSLTIIALVKIGLLKNQTRSFFLYILSMVLCSVIVTSLMLTEIGLLTSFAKQAVFFAFMTASKNFLASLTKITNTVLLLQLVKPQDSGFILGVRTVAGTSFKGLAFLLSSISSKYPDYHSPGLALVILLTVVLILYRRNVHLRNFKNE